MTIYTGRGDEGKTDLRDMTRVSKSNPRIEAYGTVDELNAVLGTIQPTGHEDLDDQLRAIQNHLHIVQADLANPGAGNDDGDDPRVDEGDVEQLETWIDEASEELDPLTSFVLPGGGDTGAQLHHARAICRRAERRTVALAQEREINGEAIRYINRLSDALFTFARLANKRDGVREDSPTY